MSSIDLTAKQMYSVALFSKSVVVELYCLFALIKMMSDDLSSCIAIDKMIKPKNRSVYTLQEMLQGLHLACSRTRFSSSAACIDDLNVTVIYTNAPSVILPFPL